MKRKGISYELGHPYLTGSDSSFMNQGVYYCWPKKDGKEFEHLFTKKQDNLATHLQKKLKKYMEENGENTKHVPTIQNAERAIILHKEDGGKWIEVGKMTGGFLAFHNLDSIIDASMGFNIGSDTLESLYKDLLCPRIILRSKQTLHRIEYPVPRNIESPEQLKDSMQNPEIFQRFFKVSKLGEAKITNPIGYEFEGGKIFLEDRKWIGEISDQWGVSGLSFVMAKICDSYFFG